MVQNKQFNANDPYQDSNNNIQVMVGSRLNKFRQAASGWHMREMGVAVFDDGEEQTDEHMDEETVLYYENTIPNKSKAFIDDMKSKFPDMEIGLSPLCPEDGDDMSRFGRSPSDPEDGDDMSRFNDANLFMDDLEDEQGLER